jgi:hypothetical protein
MILRLNWFESDDRTHAQTLGDLAQCVERRTHCSTLDPRDDGLSGPTPYRKLRLT